MKLAHVRRTATSVACGVALISLAAATAGMPAATAAGKGGGKGGKNPYQRGPTPTLASITAAQGPFPIASTDVASSSSLGFNGGTLYYPTANTVTYGGVVIVPGFVSPDSVLTWLATALASQGFVVLNINTNSLLDSPQQRSTEQLAALKYLTTQSAVKSEVDPTRLAVIGHSMGGGASLESANAQPTIKAAVPLEGWDTNTSFPNITSTAVLVVGGQDDTIAPVSSFSLPFYNGLPATLHKEYIEQAGASHFTPMSDDPQIQPYVVAWVKRWVDNDTRFSQFLCPTPTADPNLSAAESTCPF